MVLTEPFTAYRPPPVLAAKVASPPYDVVTETEAREVVKDNPNSFMRVIRPEVDFPEDVRYTPEDLYTKARENLERLISTGQLIKDGKKSFYIYRLTMGAQVQTGVVALSSIADYENNKVKKHEHTRAAKEQDRVNHVTACGAHTGPVFLAYRARDEIDALVNRWTHDHKPVYEFTTSPLNVMHEVWVMDDEHVVKKVQAQFRSIPEVYIADGHHRAAAAARSSKEYLLNKAGKHTSTQGMFMSVLFPHDQLNILGYHRIVHTLGGRTPAEFLAALEPIFDIQPASTLQEPRTSRHVALYIKGGHTYDLVFKDSVIPTDASPTDALDVALLQRLVLRPLLDIQDPRHDEKIEFVGGIRGVAHLQELVDQGAAEVAFALHPTSIDDLFQVADADQVMHPKSTWFEPKLASGLFVYRYSEQVSA